MKDYKNVSLQLVSRKCLSTPLSILADTEGCFSSSFSPFFLITEFLLHGNVSLLKGINYDFSKPGVAILLPITKDLCKVKLYDPVMAF